MPPHKGAAGETPLLPQRERVAKRVSASQVRAAPLGFEFCLLRLPSP